MCSMRKMNVLCALLFIITDTIGDTKPRQVDVYPEPFKNFVPFGQVYKEGYRDPNGDMKQPLDILEMQMVIPDKKEEIQELIKSGKSFQIIGTGKPSVFLSPRDAYMANHKIEHEERTDVVKANITRPIWLDLVSWQHKNSMSPTTRRRVFPKRREEALANQGPTVQLGNYDIKKEFFTDNSYDLVNWRRQQQTNWTTCKEFSKGASFHPKDVIDIEWVPFYIWSQRRKTFCDVHIFTYPTLKLVKHYRETYGSRLMKKVDWNQPKLYLNGTGEWLLIAADRTGLFHAIPRHSTPDYIKTKSVIFPVVTMRIKIVDPYIAYMFCDEPYAAILAVAGNEPSDDKDKELEAAALGFKGIGGPVTRDVHLENRMNQMAAEDAMERERRKYIRV